MSLQVIPSVDLRGGRVVRLKQGDYGRQINYDVDPIEVARAYAAGGGGWFHIVDLDGAKEGKPMQTPLIERMIAESGMKVQVGGGFDRRMIFSGCWRRGPAESSWGRGRWRIGSGLSGS